MALQCARPPPAPHGRQRQALHSVLSRSLRKLCRGLRKCNFACPLVLFGHAATDVRKHHERAQNSTPGEPRTAHTCSRSPVWPAGSLFLLVRMADSCFLGKMWMRGLSMSLSRPYAAAAALWPRRAPLRVPSRRCLCCSCVRVANVDLFGDGVIGCDRGVHSGHKGVVCMAT